MNIVLMFCLFLKIVYFDISLYQDDDEVTPTNPTDNDCKQLFKVAKELGELSPFL